MLLWTQLLTPALRALRQQAGKWEETAGAQRNCEGRWPKFK